VAGYGDSPHGPDRIDGLALRVEMACTSAWLVILAWAVIRLGTVGESRPPTDRASVR
jgi:hypothetical protein